MKTCSRCKEKKLLTEFHKASGKKDGLYAFCKACSNAKKAAWRKANLEKEKERMKKYNKRAYNPLYRRTVVARYGSLKSTAKQRKIEFNLSIMEYAQIVENATCYYSGHTLPEAGGGLDRIDSSKGYSIENVRPCCKLCNQAKNNLTEVEFLNLVTTIYKKRC